MNDTPDAVLTELGELRDRTRADRHAFALPLLVFGALILIAPLLYATGDTFVEPGLLGEFFGVQTGPDLANPNLVAWYWFATVVGGIALTVWWYRRRGERTGVETGTKAAVAAVVAAVALLVLGVTDAFYDQGFKALLMIAVLVIALAWLERSALLGVVAGLFSLAAVQADFAMSPWDMNSVFREIGWSVDWGPAATFRTLLLPGLILLAGGALALWTGRRRAVAAA
jgi:hypothetical protein